MTRGKSIRSVLKTIRKQVADAYICHGPVPWQPIQTSMVKPFFMSMTDLED